MAQHNLSEQLAKEVKLAPTVVTFVLALVTFVLMLSAIAVTNAISRGALESLS